MTREDRLDEGVLVDRVAEGVTERRVGQRRCRAAVALRVAAGVEREFGVAVGEAFDRRDVLGALQRVELVGLTPRT